MIKKIAILFIMFQILSAGASLAELKNLKSRGIYVSFVARDERVDDLFKALSKEFSFNVNIPQSLASKTITTTIRNMPLDRAIIRVFSLINEPNYKIEYSKTGEISAVKVFTITTKTKNDNQKNKRTYNRRRYLRRPVRRVRRPPVYREPPVIYDDELLDEEDTYYPENYDRQYQPRRRTPFIPSDEGQ